MSRLQEISQFDHSLFDSFVLFVLTHGIDDKDNASRHSHSSMNDRLFSVDMKVFDCAVIFHLFSDINCYTLSGKPKLF